MPEKKQLTSTSSSEILVQCSYEGEDLDTSVKKLLEKRRELELERVRVDRKIRSIDTALNLIGVKPDKHTRSAGCEVRYQGENPFKTMPLKQACEKVLEDNAGEWLTKTQVEYLLHCGGYESSAKDSTNSVEVTLRRLAQEDFCDVKRSKGAKGNRYSIQPLELEIIESRE
jgi:hypothetical protein